MAFVQSKTIEKERGCRTSVLAVQGHIRSRRTRAYQPWHLPAEPQICRRRGHDVALKEEEWRRDSQAVGGRQRGRSRGDGRGSLKGRGQATVCGCVKCCVREEKLASASRGKGEAAS